MATTTLVGRYYRARSRYYRFVRLAFPSAAELRFIRLMGGRASQVAWLKPYRTRQPLTIVWTLGKWLRREKFKREVRVGKYCVDFANDLHRIIELDGAAYHMDVVADMDREIYINARWQDARWLRIKAYHVFNNSPKVYSQAIQFMLDGRVK